MSEPDEKEQPLFFGLHMRIEDREFGTVRTASCEDGRVVRGELASVVASAIETIMKQVYGRTTLALAYAVYYTDVDFGPKEGPEWDAFVDAAARVITKEGGVL